MGLVHSVFRYLNDEDVEAQRRADHRDINPYASVPAQTQPQSCTTNIYYRPLSFDRPTACPADTEPLISTRPAVAHLLPSSSRPTDTAPLRQPAAAQLAPSSSQSTACSSTIWAGDPGLRPVSTSASNTTPPTPRLQQQQQEAAAGSRRPSSTTVRTDHPVKGEVTADDGEARRRAGSVTREVYGPAVVSSTPSRTSSATSLGSQVQGTTSAPPLSSEAPARSAETEPPIPLFVLGRSVPTTARSTDTAPLRQLGRSACSTDTVPFRQLGRSVPTTARSTDTAPFRQLRRSVPTTALSTDTAPLRQPVASQLALSSSQSTTCSITIPAVDPSRCPVSYAASNTTPTPSISTPRLQQQAAGVSRGPSSSLVRTYQVKREVSDDAVVSSSPSHTSSTTSLGSQVQGTTSAPPLSSKAPARSAETEPPIPLFVLGHSVPTTARSTDTAPLRQLGHSVPTTARSTDTAPLRQPAAAQLALSSSQSTDTAPATFRPLGRSGCRPIPTSVHSTDTAPFRQLGRSVPTTACSTDTAPLRQPAAAQLALSSSQSTTCPITIPAVDPGRRPVSYAASNTTPTPSISTPRLQQQQAAGVSPGPSSGLVRTYQVKREISDDAVVSSSPSHTSSTTSLGAQVRGTSSPRQNPTPSTISSPRRSQVLVAAGLTSGAVGTPSVDPSAVAESGSAQMLQRSPSQQSKQKQARVHGRLADKTGNSSPIPVYDIPPHLKEMIKLDKVPSVLRETLSPTNYNEYFACLLYAEDFYLEKWSDYLLEGVTLKIHKQKPDNRTLQNGNKHTKKLKDYVAFEIDSIPERRPYILSRDYVILQPLHKKCKKIQGRVIKVQRTTEVLVEFEDDFWVQHSSEKIYNVSFSFNRVCLKRAHHAVANALGPLLFGFLFPVNHEAPQTSVQLSLHGRNLETQRMCAVNQIANLKGFPPYLIVEPPHIRKDYRSRSLTEPGHGKYNEGRSRINATLIICEAISQIYRAHNNCRILVCTPRNSTCDTLMTELSKEIPKSLQFRANAAYRDIEDVLDDILPSCQFNEEDQCFTCPPLHELQAFKVVTSTYMSSFRLGRAGIKPGHFTHIFLVDASAIAEPEAAVPLANLASEHTAVVILGSDPGYPWYVRSEMARKWGLKTSYFNRLLLLDLYKNDSPFICRLD